MRKVSYSTFSVIYLWMNLISKWSSSFSWKEEEIKHLLFNLAKQLHLNADPGTSIQPISFAFWAAATAFHFLDLICDLSYASSCRAGRNAYKKQKASVITCPTSLSVCMLLLSTKCPVSLVFDYWEECGLLMFEPVSGKMPLCDFCVCISW